MKTNEKNKKKLKNNLRKKMKNNKIASNIHDNVFQ